MKRGPLFEKQVVVFLRRVFGDGTIERRVMGGKDDRGDVAGVFFRGLIIKIDKGIVCAVSILNDLSVGKDYVPRYQVPDLAEFMGDHDHETVL